MGGRVGEAVVGAEIDDALGRVQLRSQCRGCTVRQREEDEIGAGEGRRIRLGERQISDGAEVGVNVAHALPRVAVGGDGGDLQVRMRGDQPQQLTTGVATGSRDRDLDAHLQNYAP